MAWVVETGGLVAVANPTQKAVPASTAIAKVARVLDPGGECQREQRAGKGREHTPAIANRYLVTPAPARVATPFAWSLDPLAAARLTVRTRIAARANDTAQTGFLAVTTA